MDGIRTVDRDTRWNDGKDAGRWKSLKVFVSVDQFSSLSVDQFSSHSVDPVFVLLS